MSNQENGSPQGPPRDRTVFALVLTPTGDANIICNGPAAQVLKLLVQAVEDLRMQAVKDLIGGFEGKPRIALATSLPPGAKRNDH